MNNFLRLAAVCSVLGAMTTALLIFLPNPVAEGFEANVLLHQNRMHITKLWILFLHPQVNTLAVLGITALLIRKFPATIIPGTFFILVWAFAEMAQQAFMIDAVNQFWRPEFLQAANEAEKAALYSELAGVAAIRDSMYFLVIYGFGLGSLLLGLALYQEGNLARWLGYAFIFIGILSLASFIRYYLGMEVLGPLADLVYDWVYPVLQPGVRVALGIWLWTRVASGESREISSS